MWACSNEEAEERDWEEDGRGGEKPRWTGWWGREGTAECRSHSGFFSNRVLINALVTEYRVQLPQAALCANQVVTSDTQVSVSWSACTSTPALTTPTQGEGLRPRHPKMGSLLSGAGPEQRKVTKTSARLRRPWATCWKNLWPRLCRGFRHTLAGGSVQGPTPTRRGLHRGCGRGT